MKRMLLGIAVATLAACSASGDDKKFDEGSAGPAGTGGAGASGVGPGSGGDPQLDVDGGTGGASTRSCQYVDILFLIDDSPSMHPHQEKLAAAFPSFVDAMFDKLPPNVDLHVGLTSTAFFVGSCSETTINCATGQTPADVQAHFVPPDQENDGENGGQGRLYEHEGKNFFAVNTSDPNHQPLKDWFQGAAVSLGETGCSYEFPTAGVAYTASPANNATNAGFFRDENGVLVIFFLTDEPDKSFAEELDNYHGMVAGVKEACGGDACIVTAGLIDPCVRDTDQTLWKFMSSFGEQPIWGDIDGDGSQYADVIGDGLAKVVKVTCDEISVPK